MILGSLHLRVISFIDEFFVASISYQRKGLGWRGGEAFALLLGVLQFRELLWLLLHHCLQVLLLTEMLGLWVYLVVLGGLGCFAVNGLVFTILQVTNLRFFCNFESLNRAFRVVILSQTVIHVLLSIVHDWILAALLLLLLLLLLEEEELLRVLCCMGIILVHVLLEDVSLQRWLFDVALLVSEFLAFLLEIGMLKVVRLIIQL